MKTLVVAALILLGIYWLIAHSPPFPLSHDALGLHAHGLHRMFGVVFLIAAGLIAWKWNPQK